MATYTTKFAVEDTDPIDDAFSPADFLSIDSGSTTGQGVEVLSRVATNSSTSAARALVIDTLPTTAEQHIAVWCGSAAQASTQYVDIGLGALAATTDFAADPLGIYARLTWLADGVRQVSIRRFMRGDAADSEIAAATLVTAGGIEAEGYEGVLANAGLVAVPQLFRLVLTTEDYGMLAAVYLNTLDDDLPVLTAKVTSDFVTPTVSATDFGAWWFGFGAATAGTLAVEQVSAEDYDVDEKVEEQTLSDNQPTYGEVAQHVRLRYESSSTTNLSDERILAALRDEIEYAINRCGDVAWFLVREEEVEMAPDDRGLMTMPAKMRRVLYIRSSTDGIVDFSFEYQSTDGASVIKIPSKISGTYYVRYVMRHKQRITLEDRCPIPREHLEMIVLGVMKRLAVRDRLTNLIGTYVTEYNMMLQAFLRDNNRYSDQRKAVWRPRIVHPLYYRSGLGQVIIQ